jgi:RimJ/RimL family protein N-acetyltransferase
MSGLWRIAQQRPLVEGSLSATAWQERFLALDVAGTRRTTVALVDDQVVGFATLLVDGARPDVAAHVGTYVDPASTGRGVASALKDEQIRWARAHGFTRLEASSDPDNVAKARLYARHGYEQVPGWYLMATRRC